MESGQADLTWATGAILSQHMLHSQVRTQICGCLNNLLHLSLSGWNEEDEDKIKIHQNVPKRDWISEQQAEQG